jgi:hypothetical protein
MHKPFRDIDLDEISDDVVQHYSRAICDALNAMDIASIRQLVQEIEREMASNT